MENQWYIFFLLKSTKTILKLQSCTVGTNLKFDNSFGGKFFKKDTLIFFFIKKNRL